MSILMWRLLIRLVVLPLAVAAVSSRAAASVDVVRLEPTPLFPRQTDLVQLAYLTVRNTDAAAVALRARVVQEVSGGQIDKPKAGQGADQLVDLGNVAPGESRHSILLPDVDVPAKLTIELLGADGRTLSRWEGTHQPQRKWVVYIVKSSHEDLGYEDYIFTKQAQIADNIDLARRLSGPSDAPVGAEKTQPRRYHYQLESLLFARSYEAERSEAAWRDVIEKDVKTGRMPLIAVPNGAHTHWMDYEELARFMYPGRRDLRDRFGLDPKTFLIVDNPSISWSACQAAADAGYRYIARFGQPWRSGSNNDYKTTRLPALFWWVAPDGKHRALFGWRSHYAEGFWYGQPGGGDADPNTMDLGAQNVIRELREVESGELLGPYPYDALLIPSYSDHETPWFDARALNRWQTLYRYPEIRIAGAEDFFQHIEKKFGDTLPVLRGDLNNFSGDYATIDPESQGWKRQAARLLPLAEAQAALAGAIDVRAQPIHRQIDRTFTRLFDYDEHSWPTSPEASDVHVFNAQWVKRNEAARALSAARELLDGASTALFASVPTPADQSSLLVFNPLAHERTDLVEAPGRIDGLVDAETGEPVVAQPEADSGKSLFIAARVPAFGYKVYRIAAAPDAAAPTAAAPAAAASAGASSLRATDDLLENDFYTIRFDRQRGSVVSIFDKQLNRELVDSSAPQQFNQMVWVHAKNRTSPELSFASPAAARSVRGRAGPVCAQVVAEIDDANTGAAIRQTVRLYAGLKRIDVVNELRHVRALYSDRREDRYRESIYYAFPLRVEDFEPRAECAGGVVRPFTDQLRWGSHDFLTANRWVDVSNRAFGVTMAPWNAPTVSFGEIRYNRFSIDYKPENSRLYSYACSNRMAGLLTLGADDANATLGYSFTSHDGGWDSGAASDLGWSLASPLEARALPAAQTGALPAVKASFAEVDAANVQISAIKPSAVPGRGWVVRLVETAGKPTQATLALSGLPFGSAVRCNLVEDDIEPLAVSGKSVRVKMDPFSIATIRLFADEPAPLPAAAAVRGEALSDSSVQLRWSASTATTGGAGESADLAWNIYRSTDPDAPPTAATLVARARSRPAESEFTDTGLAIDTTYHYFVAAVTARNNQGPISAKVSVRTRARNTSPPPPVVDLGIVRRAKDGLTVYWQKSGDPDVARYFVYRSERADFRIGETAPVGEVSPTAGFLQLYRDGGLKAGTTYYYKVVAEDWAGNRQSSSPLAVATTPKD